MPEESVVQEPGCVSSRLYRDVENETALCVLEQWATRADLDAHLRSPNFRVLRGALKLLNGSAEIHFHSVSQTLEEAPAGGAKAIDRKLIKQFLGDELLS